MADKSTKAAYYNSNLKPTEFEVLAENTDGTFDIGTGKTVVVAKVAATAEPKSGCIVLLLPPKKSAPAESKPTTPKPL